MDKTVERKNAERVRRIVRDLLSPLGFARTKPTFYTRLLDDRIEFVHLHKYTFGPYFRVHMGIRFLVDTFENVALNGFDSHGRGYFNLEYDTTEEGIAQCAHQISEFVKHEGIPWFEKWRGNSRFSRLMRDKNSPLDKHLIQQYKDFIQGQRDGLGELVRHSREILGIKG